MNKELTTQDHVMVGMTSIMLFIAMKMMFFFPLMSVFVIWFNMSLFDRYGRRRRDETS